MKLDKNKVRILLAGIVILTTFASVLCYFTTPSLAFDYRLNPNGEYTRYDSAPNLQSCQDMLAALSLQIDMGFTQNGKYIKIVCFSPGYGIFAFLANSENVSVTVSNSGDNVTFNFTNSKHYQYGWNENFGFTYIQQPTQFTSSSRNILFSEITVPATSIPSFTGLNSNFSFGSQNINAYNIYNYYYSIDYTLQNLESIKQNEYDNGFESGYDSGYDIGYESGYSNGFDSGAESSAESSYQNGYSVGFSEGYNFGDQNGYIRGHRIGYNNGYDTGYEIGYNIGYDEGYEAAGPGDPEIVTEIIYRDPVDIDIGKVISGVGSIPKSIINSTFDIDIFGINVAGLLAALIIIVVTIFVIKKLKA